MIYSRFRRWIEAMGLTQTEFGALCSPPISQAVISKVLHGKRPPSFEMMGAVDRATNGYVGGHFTDYLESIPDQAECARLAAIKAQQAASGERRSQRQARG